MKYRVVIILLLTVLVAGISSHCGAMPGKKRRARKHQRDSIAAHTPNNIQHSEPQYTRKQQRRMERRERKIKKHEHKQGRHVINAKPRHRAAVVVVKRPEVVYPLTLLKGGYRVDVLMPMYLDELVKNGAAKDKIPEKALPGIAFYQGVTIAADSLKKAGFDLDVYIHDIGSAAESVNELVSKGKMDSTDLVIGAVPPDEVAALADYAKKKQVNFISTSSPADGGVTDNPFLTLLQPSLKIHCEWIVNEVARKYPGQKVMLLYRTTNDADNTAYQYIAEAGSNNQNLWQLPCDKMPGRETLKALFDTTKPNVVIISVLDNAYADSLLKALSADFPGTAFDVYGMPSWNSIPGLHKATAFPNLTVYVTDPFNYDISSVTGKYVARIYKRDYGTRPTEMVYRGYEAMFWYAHLLKQYGTIFNDRYMDNSAAPFTKFEVKQQWDKNSFLYQENTHIFLSTYQGGNSKTE